MTAAVITLSVALLASIGGLIWAVKYAADQSKRGDNAADLFAAQREMTEEIRHERDELVNKLAATDEQLKEATIRLKKTEEQRNAALAEARDAIRKEIRSAPDAIAALNKVLAASPVAGGLHAEGPAETKAGSASADSGADSEAGLLITSLR